MKMYQWTGLEMDRSNSCLDMIKKMTWRNLKSHIIEIIHVNFFFVTLVATILICIHSLLILYQFQKLIIYINFFKIIFFEYVNIFFLFSLYRMFRKITQTSIIITIGLNHR